ncbi:MAG: hypothetical protein ACKO2P_11125 [Planctomycetota bacterium]
MRRPSLPNAPAGRIRLWLWFLLWQVCLPACADPPDVAWPDVRVSKVATSFELLPPEPGSGSTQASTGLRLKFTLELINRTAQAVSLKPENFRLKSEAETQIRDQHRPASLPLEPGATGNLQLDWTLVPFPRSEEQLQLLWGIASDPIASPAVPGQDPSGARPAAPAQNAPPGKFQPAGSLALNPVLQRLQGLSVERVGPQGALAIITSLRELDPLSLWFLESTLQQLSAAGVERVLFAGRESARLVVSGEVNHWISLLQPLPPGMFQRQTLPFRNPPASFRFAALATAEIQADGSPFRQRATVRIHPTQEDAIAEALAAVYRIVPIDQALRDLESPNGGIRRAALEGAVDRLTEQQAGSILRRATTGTPAQQRDYARLLNQLPGSEAVETLRELSLSDDTELAATALTGIATSHDETALKVMSAVWDVGESRPALQTQAVTAMVASDDRRWTPLIAAWVVKAVSLTTQGQTAGFTRDNLEAAVRCLLQQRHEATCQFLQASLANVVLTDFQDTLIRQLIQKRIPEDLAAVHPVVTTRLQAGSISPEVLEAAASIRSPEWGPLLLECFRGSLNNRRSGNLVRLPVVLACAGPLEIEALIQAWEQLETDNQCELLTHLAQHDHPQWQRLAAGSLASLPKLARSGKAFQISRAVIPLLVEDSSDESLQILMSTARSLVADVRKDSKDTAEIQNLVQQALAPLAVLSHPECRRLLNQMTRSEAPWLRTMAGQLRDSARGRSPAWSLVVQSFQQRKAGDEKASLELLDLAVNADPFLPDAWVRRASARMHLTRFDESMIDLRRALELTPEHEEVQSLVALVLVRQGKVDEGLAAAEELIRQTPNDLYSLYNGACTYARAAERADTPADRRSKLLTRAIELLKRNNDAGHDEHEHMSTDPDLNILHNHPAWPELIEQARQNALTPPGADN